MKKLTCRSWGVSNAYKVKKLNQLIQGWINYFKIGSMKGLCAKMDGQIRYRLRVCIWKHWKMPKNREKMLVKLGLNRRSAHGISYAKGYARVCMSWNICKCISNERLAKFGLISMLDYYTTKSVAC